MTGVAFSWISSNTSIATVSADGVASAIAPGTTTITASAGGVSSSGLSLVVVEAPLFRLGSHRTHVVSGPHPPNVTWGLPQFADLDGNGWDDFLVTGAYYPSTGNSPTPQSGFVAFQSATGYEAASPTVFPNTALRNVHAREYAVIDLNGDGVRDWFIADHGYDAPPFPGQQNLFFVSQGGAARWNDATSSLPQASDFSHSVATGDINQDGLVDLFVGNFRLGEAYALLASPQGGFSQTTTVLPIGPGQPLATEEVRYTSSAIVDLDGDSRPELVLGTQYDSKSRQVLWNTGSGQWTNDITALPSPTSFGTEWAIEDVQPVDLNVDGRMDLVLVYQAHVWDGGWHLQFLVNHGQRVFVDETASYLTDTSVISSGLPSPSNPLAWIVFLTPRDLNGDGRMDFWLECAAWGGKIPADNCPVALVRQADNRFAPITVGALRTGGAPDFMFWGLHYSARGSSETAELVQPFVGSDGIARVNAVPITIRK